MTRILVVDDEPPMRRALAANLRARDYEVDLATKRVTTPGDGEVRLTPTEWHLVEVLARQTGKLVAGSQLLREVWGPEVGNKTNYLRVHLAHIRRKLEPNPARPRYFITEPGLGYRFETE